MRYLVAALVGTAFLAGCGSGDGDKSPGISGAPGSVGGSVSSASGSDDGSGGILLKTLAKQLAGSLTGGESYTIKGGAVTIKIGSAFSEESSFGQCQIAATARDGIVPDAPMTLSYTDRDLDCDKLPE